MGQNNFQKFGLKQNALGSRSANILQGSGAKIGAWFLADEYDILSTHVYAVSGVLGNATGTFNGIIQIQQTHDTSEYVTPAVAVEHSGTTVTMQQIGIRAPWVRAVCTVWNSNDTFNVSLRGYKQYNSTF